MNNEIKLKYNYHSQRTNKDDLSTTQIEAYVTCNVTSLSIGLSCLGIEVEAMTLFDRANSYEYQEYAKSIGAGAFIANKKLGQVWAILEKLADEYCVGTFKTDWLELSDMTDHLDAGHPILVCGSFTHGGHIICIVGYNSLGFICADPWGDWSKGYKDTNGDGVLYLYDKIREVMAGNDGKYWGLVLQTKMKNIISYQNLPKDIRTEKLNLTNKIKNVDNAIKS